jgi:hypothetical protein
MKQEIELILSKQVSLLPCVTDKHGLAQQLMRVFCVRLQSIKTKLIDNFAKLLSKKKETKKKQKKTTKMIVPRFPSITKKTTTKKEHSVNAFVTV